MNKRITILCGHYGSGKTNIAVNLAFDLKKHYEKVAIADLDIVNPYFRSKDSARLFEENGIELICSKFAGSNVDIPALPQEMYAITGNRDLYTVLDIGGDDRGAYALGRLSAAIIEEDNYEMLFVASCYRPLTRTVGDTVEIMREIEAAGKIPFTGIINNSNLGEETEPQDILNSLEYASELSQKTGLPVRYTCVSRALFEQLEGKIPDLYPLSLQEKII